MTFNNSKTLISIRIKLFAVTVIALGWLALAYVGKVIKFPLLGMDDVFWTLIFMGLWVIVAFLPMFLNYQYISYSDEGEKIVFRYFSAGMIGGRKNSVEINRHSFAGYEVEKKYFGLIISIVLFQRIKEGVAKYPPVYISALTQAEREKVFRSLNILSGKV